MKSGLFFFRLWTYLRYLACSRGIKGHGIHSPFVYDLVTRIIGGKTDPLIAEKIRLIRKDLRKDDRPIEPTDLKHAGPDIKKQYRTVSEISVSSAVPEKYGLLLHRIAGEYGKDLIIEFGTSLGISTIYMASAVPEVPLFTLEGSNQAADVAEENFRNAGLGNIRVIRGLFSETLPVILSSGIVPGLVFIDGDHRGEALLGYFDSIAGIVGENTVVAVDDINYSADMAAAWEEIRKHDKVTLTVDLYRLGLVFFKRGIVRDHYIIRY